MQHAMGWHALCLSVLLLSSNASAQVAGAQWKPDKAIEIVAPSGPGGTTDRTARVLARILTQHKLVDVPVNVTNKPGGNGIIGPLISTSIPAMRTSSSSARAHRSRITSWG